MSQAEDAEGQEAAAAPEAEMDEAAAFAHMRAAAPAMLAGQQAREVTRQGEDLEHRLIPDRDAEMWAKVAEHAAWTGGDATAFWVPSHMLDKAHGGPQLDETRLNEHMAAKLAKARGQPGWEEQFLKHNAHADRGATAALRDGGPAHAIVAARADAQTQLEELTASLLCAAGQRLCAARLPKQGGEHAGEAGTE